MEQAAQETGHDHLEILHRFRKSALSQVAILKVLEALGKRPRVAHPQEDAFHAIDLWMDQESVIQIKGGSKKAAVIETDAISFPGIEVQGEDQTQHFNSFLSHHAQKFKTKISDYESVIGRKIKRFLVAIPYNKFDSVTGEPKEDFVEMIRKKIV